MKDSFKNERFFAVLLSVFISVFAVSVFVYGATTIGTNVNTGGTLTADSASTSKNLWVGNETADNDDYIYMDASSSEYLSWDDNPGEFDLSDALNITGGVTSTFGWMGAGGTVDNLDLSNDLYVQDGVEIDGGLWADSASTTDTLSVGSGTGIRALYFGTCDINDVAITASTTAYTECLNATGVASGDNVFITATSSLPDNFVVQAASSTASNIITVKVINLGNDGTTQTGGHSFYWQVMR